MASPQDIETARKYDLTPVHAKFLDKHLLIPLLQHIKGLEIYPQHEMEDAELNLLSKTLMVDFIKAQYQQYKGEDPEKEAEFDKRRSEALAKWEMLKADCANFLERFDVNENDRSGWEYYEELTRAGGDGKNGKFNKDFLREEMSIGDAELNALYKFAKFKFDVGDYDTAGTYLHYYTTLGNLEFDYAAKWGKLAAEILVQSWPEALESIKGLQETMASDKTLYPTDGALLQARAWLMHWSLFVYFYQDDGNGNVIDDGLDKLLELWLPEGKEKDKDKDRPWLPVIQTLCPHLLRYVTAAVIIGSEESGKRSKFSSGHINVKHRMKDLIKLIDSEKRYYRDPITEFVEKLQGDCDFAGAHEKLRECEAVLDSDFFLYSHKQRFLNQGRKMIFENHCRIHSVMDIGLVAKKLNTDNDEAERYIVKMIHAAALEAKIDSEKNQVLLASQGNTIYRQVREKTKLVRDKTDQLFDRLQDRRPQDDDDQSPPPQQSWQKPGTNWRK